jgi:hypothetical protein
VTYLEAALRLLRETGQTLTIREITERAMGERMIKTRGRTPAATMRAALYRELKSNPEGSLQKQSRPGAMRSQRGSVGFLVKP